MVGTRITGLKDTVLHAFLDGIAPNNPVYLTHKSLHCGWANSSALHMAGITRNTPDPLDGRIGHHADGDPDGILFESAMGSS